MKRKTFLLSLFIITLTIFAQNIQAQMLTPGMPDPTFGTNGRVMVTIKANDSFSYTDTVVQPDGKILVLANAGNNENGVVSYRLILIRYNADGSADLSFGTGGVSNIPVENSPQGNPFGKYLHLLPDGKIIVIGTINGDFGLFRVNSNGSLDTSFGTNGTVLTDFADFDEISTETVRGFLVRPDGRLIVYGSSQVRSATLCQHSACLSAPVQRFAVAQYSADGFPDGTFGISGLRKDMFFDYGNDPSKASLDADGRLIIIGSFISQDFLNGGYIYSYGAVRYNENGAIDYGFGTNGLLNLTSPQNFYSPLENGKYLALGYCGVGCARFTRFNSDFSVDATFGTNGMTQFNWDIHVTGIDAQSDGKFIFSGFKTTSAQDGNYKSYLKRYNADGTIDNFFGTDGEVVVDLDGSSNFQSLPSKTVFQPDGKILVAGSITLPFGYNGYYGVVIMRFTGRNTRGDFLKLSNVTSK